MALRKMNSTPEIKSSNVKLIFLSGVYSKAMIGFAAHKVPVIGQTTETEHDIVKNARIFAEEVAKATIAEPLTVFSNNSAFYNGIRLAMKEGVISTNNVEFRFFREDRESYVVQTLFSDTAKAKSQCNGFMDAWETAIFELI